MYSFPIGAMVDSFRMDTKSSIVQAAEIGVSGLQMYATTGENSPENLSPALRRELLALVKDNGLVFSALCGDLGQGFGRAAANPALIEKSKRIMDLAKDLETDIVTTHIGVVPEDITLDRYKIMQEACYELAAYADSIGSHFAVETGPEKAVTLKQFLDGLHSTGVSVNLDPANLVMVTGDDPVRAVYTLRDYIVHTHAKDGRMLKQGNPDYIYQAVDDIPAHYFDTPYFIEEPLGQGDVDFPAYLAALSEIGYTGFLTIEREVGDHPAEDIRKAVAYLTTLENQ